MFANLFAKTDRAVGLRNAATSKIWLGLLLCSSAVGCHQTYHPGMYGQPYGVPSGGYGSPYGQPMPMQQMPMQQMPPTQMTPGMSAIPQENFYAPSPLGGGNAPAFGTPAPAVTPMPPQGNNGSNTVPKYNDPTSSNSPYFQQSSLRQPGQAMQMASIAPGQPAQLGFGQPAPALPPANLQLQVQNEQDDVEPATFAREERDEFKTIEQVSDEQFQKFEPPIQTKPASGQFMTDVPAPPVQEPLPMNGALELSAPPKEVAGGFVPQAFTPEPAASAAPAAQQEGLQGKVRKLPENGQWVLVFETNGFGAAPYGGQLPLTGRPELLNSLRDGQTYNLMGELESRPGANPAETFRVVKADLVGSPFAAP